MSISTTSGYVSSIELAELRPKRQSQDTGGEETRTSFGLDKQEQMVPLDLDGVQTPPSLSFVTPSTPRTWSAWIDRALRLNKTAVGMTRSSALALVIASFFFVLTTSLLVTGFQGLLPALIKDGVYANLCDPPKTNASSSLQDSSFSVDGFLDQLAEIVHVNQGGMGAWKRSTLAGGGGSSATGGCEKQKLRLNLMLTVAVTVLNLVCFPLGLLVDKTGPRWVGLGGSVVTILGSLAFAFSNSRTFDLYIPGYALIGVGGVGIFMSLLHLLNVFPEHRGFLTTLYTATEDASTGVFYIFRRLYQSGWSLRTLFVSYCAIPVAHLVVVAFQPPTVVLNEKTDNDSNSHEKVVEFYPISLQPLRRQALSPQFIAVLLWNAVMGVTSYFYLSTLNGQLIWLFGSQSLADKGSEVFSFMFMVCPFVAVPFIGRIIDRFGTWPSLLVVGMQAALYGSLASVRVWWLQYVTWCTFVVTRASFIAVSAHWVNQMFAENFTTLVGFMWTIGGVANFTNQLWVYIAIHYFKSNFLIMNIIMTSLAVLSTVAAALLVKASLGGRRGEHQPIDEAQIVSSLSEDSLDTFDSDDRETTQSTDSE